MNKKTIITILLALVWVASQAMLRKKVCKHPPEQDAQRSFCEVTRGILSTQPSYCEVTRDTLSSLRTKIILLFNLKN